MPSLTLQPSISGDARAQALLDLVARIDSLDLSPLLLNRIASAPASVLPFLLWQFDLQSPMWPLIAPAIAGGDGLDAQRSLLALGITLHTIRGTPSAIIDALEALGYAPVTILEGQATWAGNTWPSDEGWAVVRIVTSLPQVAGGAAATWDAATAYAAGAVVEYNGLFFSSTAAVPLGLPPQFASIDDVPDGDQLSDIDLLVPIPWIVMRGESIVPPISASYIAQIEAVFNFFKPARCWLDSVWFAIPLLPDAMPTPTDVLVLGGIAEVNADSAPSPSDTLGTINIGLTLAEDYPPISPVHNRHYFHKGPTYGANEPIVADGPLEINGVLHGESQ